MSHKSDLIAKDINAYLKQHESKDLLRFLTAGSVDDGKSTLIGRLLYDSKMIYEDQLAAVKAATKTHGTTDTDFDPALLTDGLKAEREQGITIDVAYRYFSTDKRKFIIADTPGHEQYTRNMATGASTCDLAIILIDARYGVITQTKRHSFITSLLGIRHLVVAVNKMDLVDWSEERFEQIKKDYTDFAARLDIPDVHFIPMSALLGDNVVDQSENMSWYEGSPLMNFLETVHIASDRNLVDFRFPVQMVQRPNLDFRGFSGTIASGVVKVGDPVVSLPSGRTSKVKSIVTMSGELESACAPMSVTITTDDEIDISRGDMICHPNNRPRVGHDFEAMVVWMSDEPLLPGKSYLIKQTTKTVPGVISTMRYAVDVNTLHRNDQPTLNLNEVGRCHLTTSAPLIHDPYKRNRGTGAFIIIDRINNTTLGAGMIIDRDTRSTKQDYWDSEGIGDEAKGNLSIVSQEERAARLGQKACTVLITGLPGSGKTTIAQAVERKLFDLGRVTAVLDGGAMRKGISKDLGYTPDERSENLRRSSEVAKLFNDSGLLVLAAFVAPAKEVRERAAKLVGEERFVVVHLNPSLEVCKTRDPDNYERQNDTADVVQQYEPPVDSDLVLDTEHMSVDESVDAIIEMLKARELIV